MKIQTLRSNKILDGGNIDMLGMTGYYNEDDPTSGFSEWIEYALQKNPNVKIFISIPPIDFPGRLANKQQKMQVLITSESYMNFL